jgi:predicted transcriptional regulator
MTEPEGGERSGVIPNGDPNRRLELTGVGVLLPAETRGTNAMPDEQPPASVERALAATIVAAYVRRNQIAPDNLASLISTVHEALGRLGKPAEAVVERTPAVPIRRSVQRDRVICLDCGRAGSMLRRHLMTAHGLTVDEYRARWNLPHDHAMTAPAYSERRSTMAKQHGLGRGRRRASVEALEPAAPESPATAPRRRGRPRSPTPRRRPGQLRTPRS